jgi:hypothetical protein
MNLPSQAIVAGKLQRNLEHALQLFVRERVVERLWAQDAIICGQARNGIPRPSETLCIGWTCQ